jgi:acetyl esterase
LDFNRRREVPQMPSDKDAAAPNLIRDITQMTPAQARAMRIKMVEASELPPEPIGATRDITVWGAEGDIPARVFIPEGKSLGDPRPILMWFHGGGMVIGDNYVQSDRPARRIANRAHCLVVAVEYRLAPEHPFPAGVDDCWASLKWAARHGAEIGGDPSRLAVHGDSGGGLPAAVSAVIARDAGLPLRHQLLVYPNLDCTMREDTWRTNVNHGLNRASMEWFLGHYLPPGADPTDPHASPVFTENLRGLAPATIIAAEFDPLIGEEITYERRLREAGVAVEMCTWKGMPHGFFVMTAKYPEGLEATDYASARLREAFAR